MAEIYGDLDQYEITLADLTFGGDEFNHRDRDYYFADDNGDNNIF